MKSQFAKYRTCFRVMQIVCAAELVFLACWYVWMNRQPEIALQRWFCRLMFHVVMLASVTGIVMCLLMIRGEKCPHCGKSLRAKWWSRKLANQILKRQPVRCPHCGAESATE